MIACVGCFKVMVNSVVFCGFLLKCFLLLCVLIVIVCNSLGLLFAVWICFVVVLGGSWLLFGFTWGVMVCVFVVGFDLLSFGGWAPDVARC